MEFCVQQTAEEIIKSSYLIYPDFTKEFFVTNDSSGYDLGAVLSQGPNGKDKPIAFASRKLNKAEISYPTLEREMLGIVWE